MLICKIFSGTDISTVEEQINAFLKKSPQITVHSISQSSDSHKVFISIFFTVMTQSEIKESMPVEQVETIVSKAQVSDKQFGTPQSSAPAFNT